MQPTEQFQPSHPQGPTVPPSAPRDDGQIQPSTNNDHTTTPELTLSLGDRFRSLIIAPLSSIRGLEASDSRSSGIRAFRALLENSDVRAVAWEHIGVYGVSPTLSLSQQQVLAATLMPYVKIDQERSWNALIKMAQHAASSQDMTTYELAGRAALNAKLPAAMIELLAMPFAEYATHNAARVPALAPWMELFIDHGSEDTCTILIDTMIRKLEAAEFSSYDHILSVLCQSRQPVALHVIQNSANPPILDETFTTPPASFLIGQSIVDAVRCIPLTVLGTYVLGGVEMVTFPIVSLSALALGAVQTWLVRRPILKELARELVEGQEAFIRSSHYAHFVDRLHEKLCALPSDRADAAAILDSMENHPLFESKRAEWQRLRAQSTGNA